MTLYGNTLLNPHRGLGCTIGMNIFNGEEVFRDYVGYSCFNPPIVVNDCMYLNNTQMNPEPLNIPTPQDPCYSFEQANAAQVIDINARTFIEGTRTAPVNPNTVGGHGLPLVNLSNSIIMKTPNGI